MTTDPSSTLRALHAAIDHAAEQVVEHGADPLPQWILDAGRADRPTVAVARNAAPTSAKAATLAFPRSGQLRALILDALVWQPLTDDELEQRLGRSHQSVSAQRRALVLDGWLQAAVKPSGKPIERPTRSGAPAQAWVMTEAGRAKWTGRRA